MSKPNYFRMLFLSFVVLFIGIIYASRLPSVRGETDAQSLNQTVIKTNDQAPNNLETDPSPSPEPAQTPHTLVGSYYLVDGNTESKLLLNNKGIVPLEVQPTLYNKQGQELQLPTVTVAPQNFRFINLSDWAAVGGESYKSGNIKLFHYGKDLVLGAQIYLTDEAKSLSYEEKFSEKGKFDSHRQEAVWWMPSNNAKVEIVLTNTTDAPLAVTGKLARKPNIADNPQTLQLEAHQTKVFKLGSDYPAGNQFTNAEVLALSFEHSGAKDALLARVMVAEPTRGYSNVVQFSNPNGGKSSEYQGVGFQIADIGDISFSPVIVARNAGTTDAIVKVRVPYTREDGTQGTISLPQKHLSAGEMGLINTSTIAPRVRQNQIKVASIEVEYNSAPGSVIVTAHSISDDHNQVFRVPMWDPLGQRSPTGGYPWRIEDTSVTETYIKNIADYDEDYIAFLVWEDGGIYMIGLKPIAAHETVRIDVKKIRDEQIPDERGRTIPLSVSSGQLQWTLRRKDNQPDDNTRANLSLIGRSEQVDVIKGIVNNYACQNCCTGDFAGGFLEAANPFETFLDLEVQSSRYYFAVEQQRTCYGYEYGPIVNEGIYNATWNTSNSNIATVTSGASGNVTGVNSGSVQISATWQKHNSLVYPCPPGGGGGGPLLGQTGETDQCQNDENNGKEKLEKETRTEKNEKETQPGDPSNIAACGTCSSRSSSFTASVNLTIKAKVEKIQYQEPGSSTYTDISGNLHVLKGTTVNFKAIPYPNNATFSAGQPFWSGTSGATGTGQTKSVTFNDKSTSTGDFKTVIASNGTPVTVNVIVYELTAVLSPQVTFTQRSLTDFGLKEIVDLSYMSSPSIKPGPLGGLRWTIQSGNAQLTSMDDGTGTFTAPGSAESSVLKLELLSGPSKGQFINKTLNIVAPSNAYMVKTSMIARNTGAFGGVFKGNFYLQPQDVSFTKIQFSEGDVNAFADGYLGRLMGLAHAATVGVASIGNCTFATGCKVLGEDLYSSHIDPPDAPNPTTGYVGSFLWAIPWRYHVGATITQFTTANHICNSDNIATATLEKKGAGPYQVAITDPGSGF